MRLTLRNLLAYMDDILEPADAKEIGRKVEESDFATSLMHRTRDVTRRLRLGAPKLEGKGMGSDANTVAEYLDNALPSERVPDFERVCLESDVHLAEVASCHQILALVLGEAAEVDPECRQRMYRLINESHAIAETEKPTAVAAKRAEELRVAPERKHIEVKRRKRRKKATVPDYLKEAGDAESSSSSMKWLAIGFAVAFVAFGAFLFRNDIEKLLVSSTPEDASSDGNGAEPEPEPKATRQDRGKGRDEASQEGADQAEPDAKGESNGEAIGTADDAAENASDDADKSSKESSKTSQTKAAAESATNDAEGASADTTADLKTPDTTDKGSPVDEDAPIAPAPRDGESVAPSLPRPDRSSGKKADDVPDAAAAATIGRLVTQEEVLLRAEANGEWRRVPNRNDKLNAGDLVLALPAFQPAISLGDLTVTLSGGSAIVLEKVDDAGVPELSIADGRLSIVFNTNRSKVRVQVKDGPVFTLMGDHEASAGLEVRRTLVNGDDPEKNPAPLAVMLHVPEGDVTVTMADGGETAVASPSSHVLLGPKLPPPDPNAKTPPAVVFPKWVTLQDVSGIDHKAAEQLDVQLDGNVSAALRLKELAATSKRVEVIALAVRCLAAIGDYEGCIPLLNDTTKAAYWDALVESLRSALARSTNEAASVRGALEKHRPAEGARLYRLLYGFSDADLATEGPQLVRDLDHADLDVRVLSFWNLRETTGATLNYRPEASATRRREAVNKWKLRQDRGDVKRK